MFCISGKSSVLSLDIFPPLDVSHGEWEIALIGFTTFNSIPNIEEGKNNLFYYGSPPVKIELPTGSYEIDDISEFIKAKLPSGTTFELTGNNNTLKAELRCSLPVHFSEAHTLGDILGFDKVALIENTLHSSTQPVNIIKVNTIRVECNISRGSYENGKESHILFEYAPSVPPGYKIIAVPRNFIYLPLNVQRINNVTVYLKDQTGELINFRGEEITLRLHVRKVS